MPHHNPRPQYETGSGIEPGTFGLADECSTTELILLHFTMHWYNAKWDLLMSLEYCFWLFELPHVCNLDVQHCFSDGFDIRETLP